MGLGENFRPRLPSRNWLIFLSITGSFTAAVIYDKREKKRVQRKWCKLVEHVAKEPLNPRAMPRTLTIFLEGPPTDGLRVAQDHFKEYVKPILVASGLDWEFIQGRKEGDIRAELAEKIRNSRLPLDQRTEGDLIAEVRRNSGIKEFEGSRGDIIIGRHTWKEYIRGLHEGWLGPVTEPTKPQEEKPLDEAQPLDVGVVPLENTLDASLESTSIEAPQTESTPDASTTPTDKPKKPPQPPPFISTSDYPSAIPPPSLPSVFDPSTPIVFPHILGFLNTPRRLYRFLNRRVLADQIGRETAAIILGSSRTYHETSSESIETSFEAEQNDSPHTYETEKLIPQIAEQQTALAAEETEWHKSIRNRVDGEPERTWLEPVVLDPRIAARMRRFELTIEDEERARGIVVPEEEVEGWIKGSLRGLGRSGKAWLFKKPKSPVIYEEEDE
jgi:import inner membrane translocase subunit TIM54